MKKGMVFIMINKKDTEKRVYTPIENIEVVKVTYVNPNPEKTRILFNGVLDGRVYVNSLAYIEILKDGKELHFVSMPTEKGRDGKYYNKLSCFIPESTVEDVRKQIEKILEE